MTRLLLVTMLSGALLSGCLTIGRDGDDVYQAEGVMLSLDLPGANGPTQLIGELLAVEPSGVVLDAFQTRNGARTVVRVPFATITRGEVLARSPRRTPTDAVLSGYRRVGALGPSGELRGGGLFLKGVPLRMLSRFPHGLDGPVLDRLLAQRGQSEILPYLHLLTSPRQTAQ